MRFAIARRKKKKKPFVVCQQSEIHAASISSDLQLIWSPKGGVHILLNRTISLRNTYPHEPDLSESTLNFIQTQKMAWSAHGMELQQNTLNTLRNIDKTRQITQG